MSWIKTFFLMIIFIFVILFSIQNKEVVVLRFGLSPIKDIQWLEIPRVPLFLPILCAVFFGMIIGGIGDFYGRYRLKRNLRENQETIERLEREIQSLRGPNLDAPAFLRKEK